MNLNLPERVVSNSLPALDKPLTQPGTLARTAAGTFKIHRFLLSGGRRDGVELLVVDSGAVRAVILPTRGMSLWRADMDGINCSWRSPVDGPVHPMWVPMSEPSGLGWLDGFDELLVRCGLRNFGAPDFAPNGQLTYPLHGRIGNLPAEEVSLDVDTEHSLLYVRGRVVESRFLQFNLQMSVEYIFAFGQPTIAVNDRIKNVSANPGSMQMLYHINIGRPLLEAGSKLHLGAHRIVARNARAAQGIKHWDTYDGPTPGYEEQVYFSKSVGDNNGWASALLTSKTASQGFAVHYDTSTLPFFTQWKNTVAEADGYVTGIEPGTGFPNPRSFEQSKGRVVQLAGGAEITFRLKLEGIVGNSKIQQLINTLSQTRGNAEATLADNDADWCAPSK